MDDNKWRLETSEKIGRILAGVEELKGLRKELNDHVQDDTAHGGKARGTLADRLISFLAVAIAASSLLVSCAKDARLGILQAPGIGASR